MSIEYPLRTVTQHFFPVSLERFVIRISFKIRERLQISDNRRAIVQYDRYAVRAMLGVDKIVPCIPSVSKNVRESSNETTLALHPSIGLY